VKLISPKDDWHKPMTKFSASTLLLIIDKCQGKIEIGLKKLIKIAINLRIIEW